MAEEQHGDVRTIQSVVVRVTHEIDRKDWQRLRALYADEVDIDYTSLLGGTPQRQRGDDLVDGWRASLATVSTQHLLGPIDVVLNGATASAECHVRAWHRAEGCPGGEEWVIGGHYTFGLVEEGGTWLINRMRLDTLQQAGNRKLLQEASALR